MAEKKVKFAEDDTHGPCAQKSGVEAGGEGDTRSRFKEKHSLDSDEEDKPDDYKVLDEDDIEGQEDATIDYDEGTKITPFNMRDELEEGHFDSEGTFIFNKEKEIRDEWMDNINWVKIHQVSDQDEKGKKRSADDEDSDSDDNNKPLDSAEELAIFQQMLELMRAGETVTAALRRLGGGAKGIGAMSASQRLKAKKARLQQQQKDGSKEAVSDESEKRAKEERQADHERMSVLTGLADRLLQHGDLEVYQHTYERLAFLVRSAEERAAASKTHIPDGTDADDALDMFADDFDRKETDGSGKEGKGKAEAGTSGSDRATQGQPKHELKLDTVQWEYKWENKEDESVHGPFSSEQMAEWAEQDYFKEGVFVRKVGSSGNFYSSRRIDFDLYT